MYISGSFSGLSPRREASFDTFVLMNPHIPSPAPLLSQARSVLAAVLAGSLAIAVGDVISQPCPV